MTQAKPLELLKHFGPTQMLQYSLTQKSPFKEAYEDASSGCYATYNHREHRRHCGDPIAEYWNLVRGVTLWDVHVEKWTQITGPDAAEFSNMLTPRDLNTCAPGQGKYVFFTNERGGIINDPVLYRLGENDFLFTAADSDIDLSTQMLRAGLAAGGRNMDVSIDTPDGAMVQIQGPRSWEVLVELFGRDILNIPYYWMVESDEEDENGKPVPRPGATVWRTLTAIDGKKMDVFVARTGFTRELGYEIGLYNASRDGYRFWKTLLAAGKPYGLVQVGPGHIRRIEGGILSYGNDINRDGTTTPFEVGYAHTWATGLTKPSWYVGKEAMLAEKERIDREGLRRELVGVEIGFEFKRDVSLGTFNDGTMTQLWPVYSREDVVYLPEGTVQLEDGSFETPDGDTYLEDQVVVLNDGSMYYLPEDATKVGDVTSACWSPRLERNIGFAMMYDMDYAHDGKNLVILTEHGLRDSIVVQKPFVDATASTARADLRGKS